MAFENRTKPFEIRTIQQRNTIQNLNAFGIQAPTVIIFFLQKAGDLAEQYGGAGARDVVEDGIDKYGASDNQAGAGGGGLDVMELLGNICLKNMDCNTKLK